MRLRLKQTTGPAQPAAAKGDWYLERGRRTVGRSNECDWQIQDDICSISKHHCTIERTMDGFILRDESANGTNVDGRLVASGESTPLANGSHIAMGRYAFDAVISGMMPEAIDDPDRDLALSDENLTISSILANVTPTGVGGHGILGSGGQSSDLPGRSADGKRRQVPIGWEGPPQTEGIQARLPDDWNDDSGLSTAMEHKDAIRSHAPRIRTKANSDADPRPMAQPAAAPQTAAPSSDLSAIEAAVRRLEIAMGDSEALLNAEPRQLSGLEGLDLDETQLALRLQSLIDRQVEHNRTLESLFDKAAGLFDPALLEARVDAQTRRFPWVAGLAYWQAYCAQFTTDGHRASVRDLLLSALEATTDSPASSPTGNQENTDPSRSEKTDRTHEI